MNPSVSTVQDFISCPLKFRLKHVVGLRKIEDEAAEHHLRFGSAMHSAMQVIYETMRDGKRVTLRTVEQAKQAFVRAYPRQLDLNDSAKNQQAAFDAIDELVARYVPEDQKRWRIVAVEAPEAYDDGYIVHLDLVMENLVHGRFYVRDWKFTKKPLRDRYNSFWNQFEPYSQIVRYCDFVKSKYGNCEGFYVAATQFGYRSRKSVNGPAGQYRIHEQQLFNVSEDRIEQERSSSDYWQTMIRVAMSQNIWGMNTDHCQWCQYRPICMAGWSWPQDADLISVQYRQVCNRLTANLRACALNIGHAGECDERRPSEDETTIEVEL